MSHLNLQIFFTMQISLYNWNTRDCKNLNTIKYVSTNIIKKIELNIPTKIIKKVYKS